MVEIEINDMQFYAHHGCYDLEQKVGTYFTVSLRLKYDATEAIEADDVTKAVNYLSVYQTIKKEMEKPSHLIEHVAQRIKTTVLKEYPQIVEAEVKLCKLNPPLGGQVTKVCVKL